MSDAGPGSETVDRASSPESDLPEVSELLSQATPQEQQAQNTGDMNASDDGDLEEDDVRSGTNSEEDEEAQSQISSQEKSTSSSRSGKDASKNRAATAQPASSSPSKKNTTTRVKAEMRSPPLSASQHTDSREVEPKTSSSSKKRAKTATKKSNADVAGSAEAQSKASNVVAPAAKKGFKKRKRPNEDELPSTDTQPKSRRRSDDKAPATQLNDHLPPEPSSPDIVEFIPSTPRPKPKTKHSRALSKATRSPNFWYLDGSVVVLVEKTLYKLHRLFGDALQTPSNKRISADVDGDTSEFEEPDIVELAGRCSGGLMEGEIVDSCPVYRIAGVSAEDFECLLTAWEMGIKFARTKPPFLTIAALMRAAHALESPNYLDFATDELMEIWPSELGELDVSPTEEQQNFAKETLLLSRQCDVPAVRKRAYYELLRTPGFGQIFFAEEDDFVGDDDLTSDTPSTLRYADLLRLIGARERLESAWLKLACGPPTPSSIPCELAKIPADNLNAEQKPALESCLAARGKSVEWWAQHVVQASLFEDGLLDPLTGLQDLIDVDWADVGFCGSCVGARRDMWAEEREKLWNKLDQ
ncbi:uncharacterized protein B0H18DRAFT_1111519, partial [Fomitopsis serialis]|uniref:uncharacterized protein n=1 Tax=Fomitopsis serialis TaxID=139415 RepID=UPI002007E2D7